MGYCCGWWGARWGDRSGGDRGDFHSDPNVFVNIS